MKKFGILLSIAAVTAVIYLTGCVRNEPPVIEAFAPDPASDTLVTAGDTVKILCQASDPDGDTLTYKLNANAGDFVGAVVDGKILWIAPDHSADVQMTCTVYDSDTLNPAAETLSIQVQNYFPMALNNRWVYRAPTGLNPVNLEVTVENLTSTAEGGRIWKLKRVFYTSPIVTDTFSYYEVRGDSIFFYNALSQSKSLMLIIPLWLNKSWGNVVVDSLKDFGTDAGAFPKSMHVTYENGIWLAPDVGIAKQTLEVLIYTLEFSLVEYDLK